ncbi:MAG: diguanylate cyclase [Luteimonas sp.]|nr:diguanylate cyclase [Luteimonas sp.]
MHRMRALGLGVGALPIASVLYENAASAWAWGLLLFNALVWPHLAWWLARRSRDPNGAEFRNLVIDSAAGGAWVAMMQFNLLPSALLLTMLTIDKIGVSGWRFLARTVPPQVIACVATSAVLGFQVRLESSMLNIVASLPFMLLYPLALSTVTYALSHRVTLQNRQLERLNRIDVLTGLPNRRHWDEAADNELARYLRSRRPAVVMLIDVDNFKEVNDANGHAMGDEVLRRVAQVLRSSLREIDTPARYGGDEFAVVLPETDVHGAREVAERIRTGFLKARGEAAAAEHCTLSIGLAEADRLLVDADDWVRRADAAMYGAKAAGRDRVNVA